MNTKINSLFGKLFYMVIGAALLAMAGFGYMSSANAAPAANVDPTDFMIQAMNAAGMLNAQDLTAPTGVMTLDLTGTHYSVSGPNLKASVTTHRYAAGPMVVDAFAWVDIQGDGNPENDIFAFRKAGGASNTAGPLQPTVGSTLSEEWFWSEWFESFSVAQVYYNLPRIEVTPDQYEVNGEVYKTWLRTAYQPYIAVLAAGSGEKVEFQSNLKVQRAFRDKVYVSGDRGDLLLNGDSTCSYSKDGYRLGVPGTDEQVAGVKVIFASGVCNITSSTNTAWQAWAQHITYSSTYR